MEYHSVVLMKYVFVKLLSTNIKLRKLFSFRIFSLLMPVKTLIK